MNEKYSKFIIKNITFPRIECLYIANPIGDFDITFRVGGNIPNKKTANILFGVRVASQDKFNEKTPKVLTTVEAIGEFEFENDLPVVDHIASMPLGANILALLYPFIREKVYSYFSSNGLQIFLPPTNTLNFIKENAENKNFKINDFRNVEPPQIEQKETKTT